MIRLLVVITLLAPCLAACGTLPDGSVWAEVVDFPPSGTRIANAAKDAALCPDTWIPAAAALALQIDDADGRIARWAYRETPVFGSPDRADRSSKWIREGLEAAWLATTIGTPGGEEPGIWALSKAKGFAVEYTAIEAAGRMAGLGKAVVSRRRPNGEDDESFPSYHAARATAAAVLASRNLRSFPIGSTLRDTAGIGLWTAAATAGWARVEAGKHHPSDVLAGMAIGHFFASFLHDAFLPRESPFRLSLDLIGARPRPAFTLTLEW